MKPTLRLFAALCVIAASQTNAQVPGSQPPGDATVRLFSTAPVHSLTVESPAGPPRHLTAGDLRSALALAGQYRLTTSDGRSATAAGLWRLISTSDGLHVVLTLPGERYVMAVLAAEASTEIQPEALKALAVAARSFALTNPRRHRAEGLCDSTHCQAMHLASDVPAPIREAVLATGGETLWFPGARTERRVSAPFTQSCGGRSASAAAVWGGRPQPWLPAHSDPYCQRQPSRWRADIPAADILAALQAQGLHPPPSLQTLRIAQHADPTDPNSRARQLELTGNGLRLVIDAATLRFAIDRHLGWNTLRSDWYDVQLAHGHAIFQGRGFGHGVGLCQFGASEMARQGRTYREILAFYYPGTKVRISANDAGWQTAPASGWTLRTTSPQPRLVNDGDAALARAQALLPLTIAPKVTLYPTTELFRQATSEPGWVLASTRGWSIALQPFGVLVRRGTYQPLLLHEFLHVAVEQHASPQAPLWLREGLVEFLAAQPAPPPTHIAPAAPADAALLRPQTLAESQIAHAAAQTRVALLVQQHGLSVVLEWLRTGRGPNLVRR